MTIKILPPFFGENAPEPGTRILRTNINGLYKNEWHTENGCGLCLFLL